MSLSVRDQLITDNLPLVGYLASELHARASHVPKEDLASAGALALVMAADAFNPDLGVPFGAYARRRILGAFADEMRSMDWASRGIRKRVKETTSVRDALMMGLGRIPTIEEIATTMGAERSAVIESLVDADRIVTSIDDGVGLDIAADAILPDEALTLRERNAFLLRAISALPDKMRAIVQAVYFEDRPIKEIAADLGVTHSAVSQQRSEAVRMLRDAMENGFSDRLPGMVEPKPVSRVSSTVREAYFDRITDTGRRVANSLTRQPISA